MIQLTDEMQHAVKPGEPVEVIDPATDQHYYLIRADQYERLRAALLGEFEVREMEPLLAELQPEDWEDASNYDDAP